MLSQACKYAIRAVLYLAQRGGKDPLLCKEIASELDAPEQFLAKILQDLVRHKLLVSFKGRGGGFNLLRATRQISLLEIVEAVDGRVFGQECFLGFTTCNDQSPCHVHEEWAQIKSDIIRMLSHKSVQQFADEAGCQPAE